jgi:putative flippase GtrA
MKDEPAPSASRAPRSLARHGAGFLVSGLIAFAVDAGITSLLTRGFGASAFEARLVAIAIAMVVAWACHRTLTFAVATPPTLAEFARYAGVASTAAAINFAVYAAALLAVPALAPEIALFLATLVAMGFSYAGMRFGVFRR